MSDISVTPSSTFVKDCGDIPVSKYSWGKKLRFGIFTWQLYISFVNHLLKSSPYIKRTLDETWHLLFLHFGLQSGSNMVG